ncbi:hypothetical protein DPMN_046869 [Dreissena polymorpha]|uniref:Uncharacterized protein n=1 Tax=Dreissena polymorpha TaxID=45954 RepID=A0A9D4D716_DREPO|nr:hypothetical protein DPMN_046869 [Dreissena polymorpha]
MGVWGTYICCDSYRPRICTTITDVKTQSPNKDSDGKAIWIAVGVSVSVSVVAIIAISLAICAMIRTNRLEARKPYRQRERTRSENPESKTI